MPAQNQRLFFALRPPPEASAALEALAQQLQAEAVVRGNWLKPPKYHITLQFLGTFGQVPDDLIARALKAGAEARFSPINIVLDRLSSFAKRRASPCILLPSSESELSLQAFWR